MALNFVITGDGSSSVFNKDFDEHYHSIHGALQESRHVFIQAGLQAKINQVAELSVLEVGLGTCLNALLTALEAESEKKTIHYTSVEKFPLDDQLYSELNYASIIDAPNAKYLFEAIYKADWQQDVRICNHFTILKLKSDIVSISYNEAFDIIYFDAFAPSAQPELWTEVVFRSMYRALKPGGILVTYCAKGVVKRTMRSVGFTIEALPGPKGKREMTRAIK